MDTGFGEVNVATVVDGSSAFLVVDKLQNSNEKKRKLEQDALIFETEIKRIKREHEKKMEEKNKIILRKKGNLKLLTTLLKSVRHGMPANDSSS